MIERTYKDVPVVQELNSYEVAAGKFADYLQALKEIGEVPLIGIVEAAEELSAWCDYLMAIVHASRPYLTEPMKAIFHVLSRAQASGKSTCGQSSKVPDLTFLQYQLG